MFSNVFLEMSHSIYTRVIWPTAAPTNTAHQLILVTVMTSDNSTLYRECDVTTLKPFWTCAEAMQITVDECCVLRPVVSSIQTKWLQQRQLDRSRDSSVGRAEDCSGTRLASLGHWFESGSREVFSSFFKSNYILHVYNVFYPSYLW